MSSLLTLWNKQIFNPKNYDGLKLWLDASDSSTIISSGGSVSQWSDKSGNDNHATQGVSSAQPTTGVNTLNGKNVITFDSGNDYLIADSLGSVGSENFTIFIVHKPVAQGDVGVITAWQRDGDYSTNQYKLEINNSEQLISNYGDGNIVFDTNNWTDTAVLQVVEYNASSFANKARVNGAPSTNPSWTSSLASGTNQFSIGQEYDLANPSNFYGGDMAEILIYDRNLSASEIMQVERYLNNEWSIY